MKRILNILRRLHAIVENRIRIHALINIKPNDSVSAFRLLQKFGWHYTLLESGNYVLFCDISLPKACLEALREATKTSWIISTQSDFLLNQKFQTHSMISTLLGEAFHAKASDIFLTLGKDISTIKFRIKRILTEPKTISTEEGKSLIKCLFALANLNQDDALYHREGHFAYEIDGETVFFRLSFIASEIAQSLVLRLLSEKIFPFSLENLKLPQSLSAHIEQINKTHHSGMILISGSTGSGKTTTAYTLAKFFAQHGDKVISLEDPIEAEIETIIQSEINVKKGYGFSNAMAAILRQDPNVIFIGEIRDFETARAAFYASLSGYWVITTLHSESLQNVSFRCQELGISFSEFSDNVKLQIHQQWGLNDYPTFTWKTF